MKNKILTSVTALTLMVPFGAYADIITSYADCLKLSNSDTKTRCINCITVKKQNSNNRIQFDTDGDCAEFDANNNEWDYFFSSVECNESWLFSDAVDACDNCMENSTNGIKQIDGKGGGDIAFRITLTSSDWEYRCVPQNMNYLGCADNWYGFPDYDEDYEQWYGCTPCPDNGISNGVTGRYTDKTECYIPSNENYKDNTGTYKYTSDCHYAE